jgi:toxin-antitoxin system PIN domain toxin
VKTALLDLNILTALLWPAHEHHEPAHRWFGARGHARWATCPLTQLGFVRIVSNPAFSRDALSPANALTLLEENLARPAHEFWPDSLQVAPAISGVASGLQGHQQVTDAYMLSLANRHKGVLATFDRGMRTLAGETLESALEIVSTR